MLDRLAKELAEKKGIPEQRKALNQMEWVQHMNNIRNTVQEIVNTEAIYV